MSTATPKRLAVYVSGPMTGHPDYNYPAFHAAAARLAPFCEVLNPARHGFDEAKTWSDYMLLAMVDVFAANAVATLPGWEGSRGARIEVAVARELLLPVMTLDDMVEWYGWATA